jgi:uncharacterized protein
MSDGAGDPSFLGTGWSFPPEFVQNGRELVMTSEEADIRCSLEILFGTVRGERFLVPGFGLEPHELFFDPVSTTVKAFVKDRILTAILLDEPRIRVVSLQIASPDPNDGTLSIALDYEVRATNSRYNLVYPFYEHDGNEVQRGTAGARAPAK